MIKSWSQVSLLYLVARVTERPKYISHHGLEVKTVYWRFTRF